MNNNDEYETNLTTADGVANGVDDYMKSGLEAKSDPPAIVPMQSRADSEIDASNIDNGLVQVSSETPTDLLVDTSQPDDQPSNSKEVKPPSIDQATDLLHLLVILSDPTVRKLNEKVLPVVRKFGLNNEAIGPENSAASELWRNDKLLKIPAAILFEIARESLRSPVIDRLTDLLEIAVLSHPALTWKTRGGGISTSSLYKRNWDEILKDAETVNFISLEYSTAAEFDRTKRSKLIDNLTHIYISLQIIRASWDTATFIDFASNSIWAKKSDSAEISVGELSASRDTKALGAVVRHFQRNAKTISNDFVQVRGERDQALRDNSLLTNEIQELRNFVDELKAQNEKLQELLQISIEDMDRNVEKYRAEILGVSSELIRLRTSSERQLVKNLDTLSNALHALQNGRSPITEEFLQLCINNMTTDINKIQESRGTR